MHQLSNAPEWNLCLNLLLDPAVSEIQSNGPGQFFIKRNGQRQHIEKIRHDSNESYLQGIENGLIPFIHSTIPYTPNSYLYEGPIHFAVNGQSIRGRCHIVLPPAAFHPQVTIAKKSTSLSKIEDIALKGSMSSEMLLFIRKAVQANMNIVISGSTGSGKTTMLEALTKEMRHDQRYGIAEDTPELQLIQSNVSYLNSVPWRPGMNPNDVATLSWVVSQFQRMRVDKIIVGETRGKEFADFLTAANSGMEGSLTTIHADDPTGCLRKMSVFALEGSPNLPLRAVNTNIASAIDIIIQLTILPDGSHKVSQIQEVTETISQDESAAITTNTLYKYDREKKHFIKNTGMTDNLREKFINRGVNVNELFKAPAGTISPGHGGNIQPVNNSLPSENKSEFGNWGVPRINPNQPRSI